MSQRNPSFTAEASLYQTVQPYYMLARSPYAGAILQPAQAPPVTNGGVWGPCVEVARGVWQREQLSTGRMFPCSPEIVCGSCLPDLNSSTGCSWDCFYRGATYSTGHWLSPCPCPPPGGGGGGGIGGITGIDQCAPCMLGGSQICERSDGGGLYTRPCVPRPGDPVAVFCQPGNQFKIFALPPGCYCGISCTLTTGGSGFFLDHWCGPYCV